VHISSSLPYLPDTDYILVFAESHGLSHTLSFYLLAITNASATLGRTIPNLLADRLGVFNMITLTSFVTSILVFIWLAATHTAGVLIFGILFGFCGGAFISLLPGVLQALSAHIGEIGVRMGIAWAVMAWAALSGTPIAG
jgi:MCP family monocarboxylic acid transporter-like MFS transporter 10